MRAWVLTDGASDHEAMCLGVAEAVADRIERRRVAPRAPWRWLARFGVADPREATRLLVGNGKRDARSLGPDVVIAAGVSAAPYLDLLKRAWFGGAATVMLGRGACSPDLRWVREGDSGWGATVISTPTIPNRVNAVRLAAARGGAPLFDRADGRRRVGVLVGDGPARYSAEDVARLMAGIRRLKERRSVVILARLGPNAPEALAMALSETADYLWDRKSPDPYLPILAQSDALVVSADAEVVCSEAVSTGRAVMSFEPAGTPRRARRLVDRLIALGAVRPFEGRLDRHRCAPLDSTVEIAHAIEALVATRAALKPAIEARTPARMRETNGPNAR